MTSPIIGVQTPSTTRANRLRQPLESPFPSSASPSSNGNGGIASPSQRNHFGLPDHQLEEISTIFQIFDPTLSGYIDIPTFEVMVRSLGFRMTQQGIEGMVESIRYEQQSAAVEDAMIHTNNNNSNETTNSMIDLSMATQILAQKGYATRNTDDEIQMYFRIFDHDNKGCITLQDLQRVQNEVNIAEREMNIGGGSSKGAAEEGGDGRDNVVGMVGDGTLQSMIDQFDHDQDGMLNYDEFKTILEPVLS